MSEDDSHNADFPKTKLSYTLDERKLLLTLVNKHKEVVNNKNTDKKSAAKKNEAWEAIYDEFSKRKDIIRSVRTPQQLKRCWENIRTKAKKGDRVSRKLLNGEEKRFVSSGDNDDHASNSMIGSLTVNGKDAEDEDSDSSFKEEFVGDDIIGNDDVEKSIKELTDQNYSCSHCQCDKTEKSIRLRLMLLEKRRSDVIHKLKVQNFRANSKREKTLHSLAVQELNLKVANEKLKSEILQKEMSQYS